MKNHLKQGIYWQSAILSLATTVWLLALSGKATTGDILQRIPSPDRCPTGLAYDGHFLWVADRLSDKLYQLDPQTGCIRQTLPAPGYNVSGLASDGRFLWVLDATARKIYKLNPQTGITEKTLTVYCSAPQGLAFDGKTLWLADVKGRQLHQISTVDGTDLRDLPAPSVAPYGLTAQGPWLWVADRADDKIYQVDPQTGDVYMAIPSPGPFPRGLAYDGQALWNVDYQTDTIYRLKLYDPTPFTIERTKREHLAFYQTIRNNGPGTLISLDIYLAVPRNLPSQKILCPLRFHPKPTDFVTDQWGQRCAHYHFEKIPANHSVTVCWETTVELHQIRYFLFPERAGSLAEIPPKIKALYLQDGAKYQIHDPFLQELARELRGKETNSLRVARRIFNFLIRRMNYRNSRRRRFHGRRVSSMAGGLSARLWVGSDGSFPRSSPLSQAGRSGSLHWVSRCPVPHHHRRWWWFQIPGLGLQLQRPLAK